MPFFSGLPPRTQEERDVTINDMKNQIEQNKERLYRAFAEIQELRWKEIPRMMRELRSMKSNGGTRAEIRAARETIWAARRMIRELVSVKYDARERMQILRNAIRQLTPLIFEWTFLLLFYCTNTFSSFCRFLKQFFLLWLQIQITDIFVVCLRICSHRHRKRNCFD